MKVNMSGLDRGIRIVIALTIAVLFWQGMIEGVLAYVLIVFAIVFIATSVVSFCPLYTLFGINTCKIKK